MNGDDAETPLTVLIVDDLPFQRRLIGETLRAAGRVHVNHIGVVDQAVASLVYFQPDIMVVDWDVDGGNGLAFVKRVRDGEGGEQFRAVPVIMVTARGRQRDIEMARNAGVDEFVVRPFSTATMVRRVMEVRASKREFVQSTTYSGPCRRRRDDPNYDGLKRRLFDQTEKNADAPDIQIRKGLVRMYCESVGKHLRAIGPGMDGTMRELCLTCGQLSTLAGDMDDRLLMSATSSLFSYVKGVGSEALPNVDVVQAHLDSIVQLAELPDFQIELRQTVTQQLTVMVTKKLRQAGAAA